MQIQQNEYSFSSTTGVSDIYACSWTPKDPAQIKGIFQIAHGMAEHSERYTEFAQFLCEQGFAVYISDHVGHGKSVRDKKGFGYFGERDGWMGFVNDCKLLTDLARDEHPGLPVIFFGHSMGSFVARKYAEKFGTELQGAIFCGTSGPNPAAGIGATLARVIARSRGSDYRSEFIDRIAFGAYNKKIPGAKTKYDWLTRDDKIVQQYIEDEACGFLFTAVGYADMFTLLKNVSEKTWYETLPKELPILLIAGDMDPVGDYGKGIDEVEEELLATGHTAVTKQLYPEMRHEILNELGKQEVFAFIADWANARL